MDVTDEENYPSAIRLGVPELEAIRMRIERSWPNIITVCSIVLVAIVEALQQALSQAPNVASRLPSFGGWSHYVPLMLLVVAGLSWLTGWFGSRKSAAPQSQQPLRIHSAVYGTGPINDIDVAQILQQHRRDGLAVLITNELFGKDPAPNQYKRLHVQYSYGNHSMCEIVRRENSRMVLPEDSELKEAVLSQKP
jgi:hypothetical protein